MTPPNTLSESMDPTICFSKLKPKQLSKMMRRTESAQPSTPVPNGTNSQWKGGSGSSGINLMVPSRPEISSEVNMWINPNDNGGISMDEPDVTASADKGTNASRPIGTTSFAMIRKTLADNQVVPIE